MITKTVTTVGSDKKYILATYCGSLRDDQVGTWEEVVRTRANVLKMLSDFPRSGSYIDVPYILEVVKYNPVETKKFAPQLKIEKRRTVSRKFKPTFHHPDRDKRESTITEFVPKNIVVREESLKYPCWMCKNSMEEVHATKGAFLTMGSRVESYTERDQHGVDVEFEKVIRFPIYKSGWVCPDCISDFTKLCSSYDSHRNIRAKLMFVAKDKPRVDHTAVALGERRTFTSTASELGDDEIVEVVNVRRTTPSSLKFHKAEDFDNSPQEIQARRNKVQRLKPATAEVNIKPSRRPKDYQKKHKE